MSIEVFFGFQLQPGKLVRVSALDLDLVVFRGQDSGQAFVTDAYCPHLGADLACGGSIKGDCVQCPFHLWSFSGETGKCQEVPYAEKVIQFDSWQWQKVDSSSDILCFFETVEIDLPNDDKLVPEKVTF